jgi:hypothetical protein
MSKTKTTKPRLNVKEKAVAALDGSIAAIKLLRARSSVSLRDASAIVRAYLASLSDAARAQAKQCCRMPNGMHAKSCATWQAKQVFDEQRSRNEALGMEVCMVVVGYVSGRDPFRLLGRVAADTGMDSMPDPPLTMAEMQPVAFAAKMALAKAFTTRRKSQRG